MEVDSCCDDEFSDDLTKDLAILLSAVTDIMPSMRKTMTVRVNIRTIPLVALLDFGSTHNFIANLVAARMRLIVTLCSRGHVTVTNDERLKSLGL
ncbi:hypothetical protein GUJ93_ZPchr0010g8690 [Zizania palustris]|uniref:Uncharacterized protein n=1 Tax=Zizania palustris TaxID=103762 RepID=A0A8J6BNW6_ZIZPA|nr:hypothetical protein GUJ93_ZPchr0010g8690 [Zizania palustris]